MTIITAKWTIDDYHKMIEAGILDDRHVELLNGEITEMSPEGEPHAHLSTRSADYLRELLRGRAHIRVDKPITLPGNSEPEPDIAIVQPLGDIYFDHHPYPENIFWLIEFSNSSLAKDLEIKSKVYAKVSISEYWVVNLQKMELIVFREPIDSNYQSQITLNEGEITPISFPDISVSISQLLKK
ncbi:Uma2 family endonuclease [Phormidesmis sp. 146-12]